MSSACGGSRVLSRQQRNEASSAEHGHAEPGCAQCVNRLNGHRSVLMPGCNGAFAVIPITGILLPRRGPRCRLSTPTVAPAWHELPAEVQRRDGQGRKMLGPQSGCKIAWTQVIWPQVMRRPVSTLGPAWEVRPQLLEQHARRHVAIASTRSAGRQRQNRGRRSYTDKNRGA